MTKSFDLLWRGIELTTGAQREHRYERLLAQAQEKRIEIGPIQYYPDFFRFGAPPHGGFGFGLTRLLMQLLGQAAADRIGLNATDLNCLNILSFSGEMTAGERARASATARVPPL